MKYLAFLSLILFYIACSSPQKIKITGSAIGVEDGVIQITKDGRTFDASIQNQKFSLVATIPNEDFYTLKVLYKENPKKNKDYIIYLSGSNLTISIDSTNTDIYPKITSSSPVQQDLNEFYKILKTSDQGTAEVEFIRTHSKSLVSAYFLSNLKLQIDQHPFKYEKLFKNLHNDIKNSMYGQKANVLVTEAVRTAIGQPMPDLAGITPSGKPFDKAVLDGKLTLLAFWASWNNPSKRDIPQLQSMYGQYHKDGFEIVGIAIDKHEDKWKKFIHENQLNWLHVADFKGAYSENFERFYTNRLPDYILIDPNLNILDKDVKIESVEIYIREYIKGKKN